MSVKQWPYGVDAALSIGDERRHAAAVSASTILIVILTAVLGRARLYLTYRLL